MPTPAWRNPDLPPAERARDLVGRMTLSEKVSQMMHDAPAIERLGVPAYNWWNECLHGVGRAGVATVFPQAIGMAAAWNDDLLHRVAVAISDEARAKHHEALRQGDHGWYRGLTFWSPNINIFRDPRWGRGQETYGEDPYLTSRMGVAFVRGLQGDDPRYLKLVATPKHYAVHSGPERLRHEFDARVSRKDLYETYLPAFRACVQEGGAASVMGAYNRTGGEPCCASPTLLGDILRGEWGFAGYVVSDCGAISDIHERHRVAACSAESAALSVRAGCDLECGCVYAGLLSAVQQGLIGEGEIDTALTRLMLARLRLGMFDPPERVPWAAIPYEVNDCEQHRRLALEMARQSLVLLRNEGDLLPLRPDLGSLAVIGPNAESLDVLLGNYNGTPSRYVTLLDGIRARLSPRTRLWYAQGCEQAGDNRRGFSEAVSATERADAVILCLGLTPRIEGEEGDAAFSEAGGDRITLGLPAVQQDLLERIVAVGRPTVLVLTGGSAISLPWAAEHVPAILGVWYPGEEGGTAVAEALFGEFSPAGRLPVTVVRSLDDLPPFEDYRMQGRTYRYLDRAPLWPFGFGLSYTSFAYSGLRLAREQVRAGESLEVRATVTNTGSRPGDEVAQVYLSDLEASLPVPVRALAGFRRVHLEPGESQEVAFTLAPEQLCLISEDGKPVLEPGRFRVTVAGSQGDARSLALGAAAGVSGEFEAV